MQFIIPHGLCRVEGKGTSSKHHKNFGTSARRDGGRGDVGWCVSVLVCVGVVIHLVRVTGLTAPI